MKAGQPIEDQQLTRNGKKGGDKVITIRMDYGEEHKYKKAEFFPGFVKVETDKGVKLIPYHQTKHITYDDKKYHISCDVKNGMLYFILDTKSNPVTEKSSATKTKKEVAKKKK